MYGSNQRTALIYGGGKIALPLTALALSNFYAANAVPLVVIRKAGFFQPLLENNVDEVSIVLTSTGAVTDTFKKAVFLIKRETEAMADFVIRCTDLQCAGIITQDAVREVECEKIFFTCVGADNLMQALNDISEVSKPQDIVYLVENDSDALHKIEQCELFAHLRKLRCAVDCKSVSRRIEGVTIIVTCEASFKLTYPDPFKVFEHFDSVQPPYLSLKQVTLVGLLQAATKKKYMVNLPDMFISTLPFIKDLGWENASNYTNSSMANCISTTADSHCIKQLFSVLAFRQSNLNADDELVQLPFKKRFEANFDTMLYTANLRLKMTDTIGRIMKTADPLAYHTKLQYLHEEICEMKIYDICGELNLNSAGLSGEAIAQVSEGLKLMEQWCAAIQAEIDNTSKS